MRSTTNYSNRSIFAGLLLSVSVPSLAIPSGGPIPEGAPLSSVAAKAYAPGTLDLPPTAYLIPNSAFVILDPAKSNATSTYGALLGPLGVLLHGAVGKGEVSKAVDGTQQPLVDLVGLVQNSLAKTKMAVSGNATTFEITPSGWIIVKADSDKTTLSIKLDVQWKDSSGDVKWRQDYYYSGLQERTLVGTDGWLTEGNPALRQASEQGVSKLVNLFLRERSMEKAYSDTEIKLSGCFATARKLTLLAESDDEIVVRVQGNRASGSSIQVLSRAQCAIVK